MQAATQGERRVSLDSQYEFIRFVGSAAAVAGAMALVGILLRAVFNIALVLVRPRKAIVDQSDADLRISQQERMPPTFADRFPPPRPLNDTDANHDFEEMLRLLRERERQAA